MFGRWINSRNIGDKKLESEFLTVISKKFQKRKRGVKARKSEYSGNTEHKSNCLVQLIVQMGAGSAGRRCIKILLFSFNVTFWVSSYLASYGTYLFNNSVFVDGLLDRAAATRKILKLHSIQFRIQLFLVCGSILAQIFKPGS